MEDYGIPEKIIDLVKCMYSNSECAVVDGTQHLSSDKLILHTVGVQQIALSLHLVFCAQVESEARMQHVRFPVPPIVIDWIMRKTTKCTSSSNTGIRWNITSKLEINDLFWNTIIFHSA
jgi:hypothetical protein